MRLTLISLAATAILGCAAVPVAAPPPLALTIVASQTPDGPAASGANASPVAAYRVVVTAQNPSGLPFDYDRVDGAFFLPTNRRAIRPLLTTAPRAQSLAPNVPGTTPGAPRTTTLAAGAAATFEFSTAGKTNQVLRGAGSQPLSFGVTFWYQGVPVTGLYAAQLPPIADLPQYQPGVGAETTGRVLALTRRGE